MKPIGRPARPATAGLDLLEGRWIILAALLAISVVAWVVVVRQAAGMAGTGTPMLDAGQASMTGAVMTPAMPSRLTMGMAAPVFLAAWSAMMAAMMLPSAAPMVLMFSKVQAGRRSRGQQAVSTWVFVAAYLLVWTLFGVVAFDVATMADRLAGASAAPASSVARIGGLILILAGAYQLSPLKNACLTQCRSPAQFVLTAWKPGIGGAFWMGLEHGLYCLGCCWLLFVALFPLGVMNVAAMVVVTALVFAEKALPLGATFGRAAAWAIIVYGVAVVNFPAMLPVSM